MNCLVTGGAGFIGSNLALELERQGNTVTIVDNMHSGHKDNIKEFKGTFIEADVAGPLSLDGSFEVIFHIAAITDPRHPDDEETYSKNISGFENILELAKKSNAKLVYASTAGLYGNGPVPMKEDQDKEILSVYGKSKWEMDQMAEKLFDSMHIVGLRYFNVFGPREAHKGRPASMIYHLALQIRDGKNPRLFKWGEQIRDHIYVKDVVDATIKAVDAKQSCIVNVGTGIGTPFKDLVPPLNDSLGKTTEIEYFDMNYDPKTYQSNTQADTAKAKKLIGFEAQWTLKDGIKDYVAWLEKNGWDQ